MAKETAIFELGAGLHPDAEGNMGSVAGGFNVPWVEGDLATRALFIITDNPPGGFDDANSATDDTHLEDLGDDASDAGIAVFDLLRGNNTSFASFKEDAERSGGAIDIINLNGTGVSDTIIEIITDPEFCVPPAVAGELLPVDTTALFVAGLAGSLTWLVPVAAGAAGVGIYFAKTRMNKGL